MTETRASYRSRPADTISPADALRASAMTEKELLETVIKYADALGWKFFHVFDSRRSVEGWPDLVLVRSGGRGRRRMIFAELKSQHGRLSATQREWLDALRAFRDVEVYEWRPSNLEAIWETLQ